MLTTLFTTCLLPSIETTRYSVTTLFEPAIGSIAKAGAKCFESEFEHIPGVNNSITNNSVNDPYQTKPGTIII
jgi:hypothetical protein